MGEPGVGGVIACFGAVCLYAFMNRFTACLGSFPAALVARLILKVIEVCRVCQVAVVPSDASFRGVVAIFSC